MARNLAIAITLLLLTSVGCKVSFTGGSQGAAKTVSVKLFQNNAPIVNPTLSQSFSESLRDFFVSQSRLQLVQANGDIQLEGTITGYNIAPVAIQGNQTAGLNRLTVTVSVKCTNLTDETKNFEQNFTRFSDWQSNIPLPTVEADLVRDINTQLVQDIFNKALVNW